MEALKLPIDDFLLIKEALQEKLVYSTSETKDIQTALILDKLEKIIIRQTKPRGVCRICQRGFSNLDMQVEASRPEHICMRCFTSNA